MKRRISVRTFIAAAVATAVLAAAGSVTWLVLLQGGDDGPVGLTWDQLRNQTYPSELTRSKRAPLKDGLYEEEVAPGSATRLSIRMADIAGFGTIDAGNSVDAAVVLIGSPGGTGTFIYLAAVLNMQGAAVPVATVLLGDRVAVRAIRVEDHKVVVAMRVRGTSDPLALLTREVTRTYALVDNGFALEREESAEAPSEPPGQFSYAPERLNLAAGKTEQREATLKPGELATYLVHGQQDQELSVAVRSQFNNAVLSIQGIADNSQLVSRTSYATNWSGRLPATQDYAVTVVTLAGNDLRFALSVQLGDAATPASRPTAAPTAATPASKPTAAPTATATATPRANPTSTPPVTGAIPAVPAPIKGAFKPTERPLATLSSDAAAFLDGRERPWSAAVASPAGALLYSQAGDTQLELASTVKVLIALAVLDAAQRDGRYVDRAELALLWPMITISDNDSATKLWDQVGGGRGLGSYLAAIGASGGITPYDGSYWGTSTASADALASLLARAIFGDLLNSEHRGLLIQLIEKVVPAQRWGISAGAEGDGSAGDIVGIKDGWYPDEAGWRVNSIGFVLAKDGGVFYTIAVLTNRQSTWDYGIETIEGVAERVRGQMH